MKEISKSDGFTLQWCSSKGLAIPKWKSRFKLRRRRRDFTQTEGFFTNGSLGLARIRASRPKRAAEHRYIVPRTSHFECLGRRRYHRQLLAIRQVAHLVNLDLQVSDFRPASLSRDSQAEHQCQQQPGQQTCHTNPESTPGPGQTATLSSSSYCVIQGGKPLPAGSMTAVTALTRRRNSEHTSSLDSHSRSL